jgi:putative ABC transport system ATP-binding protein
MSSRPYSEDTPDELLGSSTLSNPQLLVAGCSKRFRSGNSTIVAVDHLDLAIPSGQIAAVVGSNGAGKSTLLSLIAGSLLPDDGQIVVAGEDLTLVPSWRRARSLRRVRQSPEANVLATLTIEENFALALTGGRRFRLRPALSARLRHEAREVLAPFGLGLEDRLHVMSEQLSGGQRQAVAVAMASVGRPSLLLLDEHVAALDPASANLVMAETERLVREHRITTLMVTHDMKRALAHSDRVLMMHRGRIVLDLQGEEKSLTSVADLVQMFEHRAGDVLPDRSLLR